MIGGIGILASLLVGGIVYGLADSPATQESKPEQEYNTSLNRSPEQDRLESLPAVYEPEAPSPPPAPKDPAPEPEPLPPALTPQPGYMPGPPPEDPMKAAARQSAISFFNNADPRQSAGLQNLLPSLPAQPDASLAADGTPGESSAPSPGVTSAVPAPAGGAVNPFVTLAAASGPNTMQSAPRGTSQTVYPGTIIKARLDTAIDTTHPSTTRARVIETVFDHKRGLLPVIPQGTTLIGEPTSNTRYGQERVFIAWTQMTLPDGRIIDVSGMSAGDAAGRGGKEADVDNHYPELFATAVLSSLLSVGATAAGGEPEDPLTLQNRAAQGLGNSVSNTGTTLLGRAAAIPPTLTLEPGELVTIIVNRPITVQTVEPK